jgi:hypothetical protein
MEALVIKIGKLTKGLIVKKPKKKKRVYMDMDDRLKICLINFNQKLKYRKLVMLGCTINVFLQLLSTQWNRL